MADTEIIKALECCSEDRVLTKRIVCTDALCERNQIVERDLMERSPIQGVSIVEQMAQSFIEQKEKDITKAIMRVCFSVGVDPEALVKTAQLNATLKDKLYEIIERFSWVPCSERMPLKDGDYLLLIKSKMTGY